MEEIIQEIYSEIRESDEGIPINKVMPLLLFRKLIEKIDAINILYKNKSGSPALSLARGVIENYWYFMFMVEEDSDFRALSYYYHDKRDAATKSLKELDYQIGESLKYKKLRKAEINDYQNQIDFFIHQQNKNISRKVVAIKILEQMQKKMVTPYDKLIEDYEERIRGTEVEIEKRKAMVLNLRKNIKEAYNKKTEYQEVIKRLNQDPRFKDVRDEIKAARIKYASSNVVWYTLRTGLLSIRELSVNLNFEQEYRPYSSLSQEVHVSNATNQINVDEDGLVLSDLRDEKGSELALANATSFLSYAIKPFLIFYNKERYYAEISKQMNYYINK